MVINPVIDELIDAVADEVNALLLETTVLIEEVIEL
jgi:hypothetical protein